MNKKVGLLLVLMAALFVGCGQEKKSEPKPTHYQKVMKQAQKEAKKEQKKLQSVKTINIEPNKNYFDVHVDTYPTTIKMFNNDNNYYKHPLYIAVSGVVTGWDISTVNPDYTTTYDKNVTTNVKFYVNQQLNYKNQPKLVGQTITFKNYSGYAKVSDPRLAENQNVLQGMSKDETVFVQINNKTLPQIGEQMILLLQPLTDSKEFMRKGTINKNSVFQYNFPNSSAFKFNKQKQKYELIPYAGSEETTYDPHYVPDYVTRSKLLLKDINSSKISHK